MFTSIENKILEMKQEVESGLNALSIEMIELKKSIRKLESTRKSLMELDLDTKETIETMAIYDNVLNANTLRLVKCKKLVSKMEQMLQIIREGKE